MNKRLSALASILVVTLLAAGCAEDPTEGLRSGVASVSTSRSYVELVVGESVTLFAQSLDAQGNQLGSLPVITSANNSIATVATNDATSGVPEPQTNFTITAVAFGTTIVTATDGTVSTDITVIGLPASVEIIGAPVGNTGSGAVVPLSATALDVNGVEVTGLEVRWSDDGGGVVSVDALTGVVSAQSPGVGVVTATIPLGDSTINGGAYASADVTVDASFIVVPGTFTGTLSSTTGGSAALITVTRDPAGDPYDSDTEVLLGITKLLTGARDADNISFAIPIGGATGDQTLVVQGIGANQLAQATTFTVTADPPVDGAGYLEPNDDPFTAPIVSADGDYLVLMSGPCVSGVGAGDCDDWLRVSNTTGADAEVDLVGTWSSGQDNDFIWFNAAVGFVDCSACTGANPEFSTVTIPAGEIWFLLVNLWVTGGTDVDVVQINLSGL